MEKNIFKLILLTRKMSEKANNLREKADAVNLIRKKVREEKFKPFIEMILAEIESAAEDGKYDYDFIVQDFHTKHFEESRWEEFRDMIYLRERSGMLHPRFEDIGFSGAEKIKTSQDMYLGWKLTFIW